jgi:cytidylate kinase
MTVLAIDGPAGAGKSTVGRAVARALGWRYVDTGAMYRAVALAALERGLDPDDAQALERLAPSLHIEVGGDGVALDGVDVSERIRRPDVTRAVSTVSAHRGVRAALTEKQRSLSARGDVVMEGRDIGGLVAPDAAVKIFLTASLPERARRRARQLDGEEEPRRLEELQATLAARDAADAARAESPFTKAPGAIVIDSTGKDVGQIVDEIVTRVRTTLDQGARGDD